MHFIIACHLKKNDVNCDELNESIEFQQNYHSILLEPIWNCYFYQVIYVDPTHHHRLRPYLSNVMNKLKRQRVPSTEYLFQSINTTGKIPAKTTLTFINQM